MMDDEYCKVCAVNHTDDHGGVHNNTPTHRFNFMLFEWNNYRKALAKSRHGVELSIQPKAVNGYVYNYHIEKQRNHCLKISPDGLLLHKNTLEFLCTVKNIQNKNNVFLTSALLLHPYELFSLHEPEKHLESGRFLKLLPGAEYSVVVRFTTKNTNIGSYKIPVSFNFQTEGDKPDTFTIARAIIVSVEEEILEDESHTKSPFTNTEWPSKIGLYPPTKKEKYSNTYHIPSKYFQCLKYGLEEFAGMVREDFFQLASIRKEMEPGYVTETNYKQYWHNVLWLEEMGQILMLRRYNMENVNMKLNGRILELEVPGLAEKRPSVIVGDMIDIKIHGDHSTYRGIITAVNDKTVDINYVDTQLLNYIKTSPEIELDVRFVLGRLPLERMHQGVDQTVVNGMVSALFPDISLTKRHIPELQTLRDTEFFNELIVRNAEQKNAVQKILNGTSLDAPYIVFGPPGTGKTVTIVEAILQIKTKTTKKILICAPANAACDMLTEKLMVHCSNKELIRIMSENVDKQNMNHHIKDYINIEEDGSFKKITPQELRDYRIVVTTLILIGRYSRKYHPDVVFVDEGAQACEPEVNCAIGMLKKGKQIILAGDPRQLGPSISSTVADKYGLKISLLERLMNLELYKSQNSNFITMLKLNFRSHSTILTLPNKLFYENQLVAHSPTSENDPLAKVFISEKIQSIYKGGKKRKNKQKIKNPGQAVEFRSVVSKESREGRSPSYFNVKEMQTVLKYVEALINLQFDNEEYKVLPEQIGVVTPYIRQVYKIRDILRRHGYDEVEVGTTETFQGREKRVIIISTVRAQQDLLLHDRKYNLGFVRHEKRFNVALTRAMSKLIIIGCPHVLGTDSKWLEYIEFCEDLHAFSGAPYARRTKDVMDNICSKFSQINMKDSQFNH